MADDMGAATGWAAVPAALQQVVDAGDVAGMVTLAWRKGEVAQVNALGMADIAAGRPMARDTIFRIASMTKLVTSAAFLMLVEEGKVGIDDPITRWAPELADMTVLNAPDADLDDVRPAPRDITFEDLLTHRAGLCYGFTAQGPLAQAYMTVLGPPMDNPYSPDEWLARLGTLPLIYAPGERWRYSMATDVLGFLVGRIEGRPLRDVVMSRFFEPLGMVDTDFWLPPEKRDRLATMYRPDGAGGLTPMPAMPLSDRPPAWASGGGGLFSTADDYLRFARMLLNGELDGRRYLSPESIALMATNRLTDAQRQLPFLGQPFFSSQGFGLGASMIVDPANHAWRGAGAKGAFGWWGAFGTVAQIDPAEDMVLIYLVKHPMPFTPAQWASQAAFQRLTYAAAGA